MPLEAWAAERQEPWAWLVTVAVVVVAAVAAGIAVQACLASVAGLEEPEAWVAVWPEEAWPAEEKPAEGQPEEVEQWGVCPGQRKETVGVAVVGEVFELPQQLHCSRRLQWQEGPCAGEVWEAQRHHPQREEELRCEQVVAAVHRGNLQHREAPAAGVEPPWPGCVAWEPRSGAGSGDRTCCGQEEESGRCCSLWVFACTS